MKLLFSFIFFFLVFNFSSSAQNTENRAAITRVKKLIKDYDLAGYSIEIRNIVSGITKDNLQQKMQLIDNIYNLVEGEFNEATDTAVDVLRRNYLPELLKYLSARKDSNFENAYVNFMVITIKYAIQKQVAVSNFESNVNKAISGFSAAEKDYAVKLKDKILSKCN